MLGAGYCGVLSEWLLLEMRCGAGNNKVKSASATAAPAAASDPPGADELRTMRASLKEQLRAAESKL